MYTRDGHILWPHRSSGHDHGIAIQSRTPAIELGAYNHIKGVDSHGPYRKGHANGSRGCSRHCRLLLRSGCPDRPDDALIAGLVAADNRLFVARIPSIVRPYSKGASPAEVRLSRLPRRLSGNPQDLVRLCSAAYDLPNDPGLLGEALPPAILVPAVLVIAVVGLLGRSRRLGSTREPMLSLIVVHQAEACSDSDIMSPMVVRCV